MKILTWNCAMCFRDKLKYVLPMAADILVIPECEAPEKWKGRDQEQGIHPFLWFGENPNKGLGVFSMNESYHLKVLSSPNDKFPYIVPIEVSGKENFILLAVWAQRGETRFESYIGQIYRAIHHYEALLDRPCLIVGDWNSNKLFDRIKRVGNHTTVVENLKARGIESAYHRYFNEEHGAETKPTHYFWRKQERSFHLDYLFASRDFLDRMKHVEVGSFEDWIAHSDHMPVVTEFGEV